MNFKTIFYTCSIAAISSGIYLEASAQTGKPLFPQTPGLQTYTFRNSMKKDVAAALDSIKSLGITVLESSTNPQGMSAEAFRKLLDERNMSSPSVGADYNELVKNPAEIARKAKIIGASYVMVAWIPHQKEFTLEDAKKAITDFNAAGKVLKEKGITLCYHPHGYEFASYQDGTLFDYMVKNTNPKYVSFELDMLWAFHGGQDPAQLLLKYPTRWKLVHLKDLRKGVKGDLTGGTSTENDVALGTGQLNVPEILKAAKKVGVKYYFIEDESSNYGKQIPQTMAYLKSLQE
ncbi:sugar phosphate isomerase/epimerase family protein [Rubrolithibacter danxiaensis]|uniref:sugar phosphate isomerase/epimerase family protein n=1 Tax=Rubrolithibacter danxiaensis TaxID=3390805 RepID=UPI003BF7FA36